MLREANWKYYRSTWQLCDFNGDRQLLLTGSEVNDSCKDGLLRIEDVLVMASFSRGILRSSTGHEVIHRFREC